jgi:TIR domain
MSSLADLPELIGFFSYSREDDADSQGALSALRGRIQGELRGQLGRTAKTFRLWQDKEAIPSGTLWESEINNSVEKAAFFIPIITPTVVSSPFCRFELDAFLAREAALGRNDLVFPILYIHVPAMEDSTRLANSPVLSLISRRQYFDWREFRHLDSNSTEVKKAVERFCGSIRDALNKTWVSPEERKQREAAVTQERAEAEQRQRTEAGLRAEEEASRKRTAAEAQQKREAQPQRSYAAPPEARPETKVIDGGEVRHRAAEDARFQSQNPQARSAWMPSRSVILAGSLVAAVFAGAIGAKIALAPGPVPVPPAPVTPVAPAPVTPIPSPPAPAPSAPAHAAITPIPGLRASLGDSIDKVRSAYNLHGNTVPDCSASSNPCVMLVDSADGLTFFFKDESKPLNEVRADAPFSGSIAGVHIGDQLQDVLKRLGQPTAPPWEFGGNKAYLFRVNGLPFRCDVDSTGKVVTILYFTD